MSWKENVYRNRMLMNSGKLMDGQICVKKKKNQRHKKEKFNANCFLLDITLCYNVNMTCLLNVIYFLEKFLHRNNRVIF